MLDFGEEDQGERKNRSKDAWFLLLSSAAVVFDELDSHYMLFKGLGLDVCVCWSVVVVGLLLSLEVSVLEAETFAKSHHDLCQHTVGRLRNYHNLLIIIGSNKTDILQI